MNIVVFTDTRHTLIVSSTVLLTADGDKCLINDQSLMGANSSCHIHSIQAHNVKYTFGVGLQWEMDRNFKKNVLTSLPPK